jgi:ubiquitin carboxyl-terminal hydrolase 31
MRNIKNAILDYQHSSSIQPHGFKVTKSFVQIFQALWNNSSNTTSKLSYDFKSIIGNLNRQYSGNDQNDAQEFLLFLINTIHDELNLVAHGRIRQQTKVNLFLFNKKKKTLFRLFFKNSFSSITISSQSSSSLASAELARRAWSDYTDANQSIITTTFSAQLHSTLHCNQCKQESKTFEPYLLLSLPIPQKIIKPVFITVVFLNQSPKQLQIGLCLPVTNTVKDVREAIAQQSNLDPNDVKKIFFERKIFN